MLCIQLHFVLVLKPTHEITTSLITLEYVHSYCLQRVIHRGKILLTLIPGGSLPMAANCGTGEEGRQPEDAPRTAVGGKISEGWGGGDETMQEREPRMEPRWKEAVG
jgi:hypothetical protein